MSNARTRQEHMEWCKKRALAYLDPGEYYSVQDAAASMASDLSKHDETSVPPELAMVGLMEVQNGEAAVRKWINGFN